MVEINILNIAAEFSDLEVGEPFTHDNGKTILIKESGDSALVLNNVTGLFESTADDDLMDIVEDTLVARLRVTKISVEVK